MSKIVTFDMGRYYRVVGVEHARIRGDFVIMQSNKPDECWIEARDLVIWDEGHHHGVVLGRDDFKTSIKGGVVEFHERDVSERRRADVLEVLDEMKRVVLAVADAAAYQDDDFKSQITVDEPQGSGS